MGFKIPFSPTKIEWNLTNGLPSAIRTIRYSGLGVRSVGPVGDFLDLVLRIELLHIASLTAGQVGWSLCLFHRHIPSHPIESNCCIPLAGSNSCCRRGSSSSTRVSELFLTFSHIYYFTCFRELTMVSLVL